ncbi:pre-peptidase C-terminal domain-containing protein [Halosimplex halobium]|uniref:pre-peptidase C-terminal domain-containing protein n=1 Tax=Halosimplex halobium TaxID=3396618 RepID=UPI003F561EE6
MTLTTSDSESEPNDTRATATPIQTGVNVNGRLSPAEVDWFAFDVAGGATLTVQLTKNGKAGVVSLVAYDTSGSFVNEVYVSSDAPVDLEFVAAETGTYFVQIVDVESGNGAYELRVDTTGGQRTATPTPTPTATETATPTATSTETATAADSDYGLQGYGEYGYGGTT